MAGKMQSMTAGLVKTKSSRQPEEENTVQTAQTLNQTGQQALVSQVPLQTPERDYLGERIAARANGRNMQSNVQRTTGAQQQAQRQGQTLSRLGSVYGQQASGGGQSVPQGEQLSRSTEQAQQAYDAAKAQSEGLWDDFMNNQLDDGLTVRDAIASNEQVRRAREALKTAQREQEGYEYVQAHEGRQYDASLLGQARASYEIGRLSQDAGKAYNEYLNNPTEANLRYAQQTDRLLDEAQENNREALAYDAGKLSVFTQDYAQYLPQFFDQLGYQAVGGGMGALAGLAAANPALGAKAGAVAASGLYSYQTMRGAAFRSLLELGIDEQTARAAAGDEAVISSAIEMLDTAKDLAAFGGGKVIDALTGGAAKAASEKLSGALAKYVGKNLLTRATAGILQFGLGVLGEGLEESSQEIVSIANERRAENGQTGIGNLLSGSYDLLQEILSGEDEQSKERVLEAGRGGIVIGAIGGGLNAGTNAAVSGAVNAPYRRVGSVLASSPELMQEQLQTGLSAPEGSVSRILAEAVQNGDSSTLNLGRLYAANETYLAQSGAEKVQRGERATLRELTAALRENRTLEQAAQALGVQAQPEAVLTAAVGQQQEIAASAAVEQLRQENAVVLESPSTLSGTVYNSAVNGAKASQSTAWRINSDPQERAEFAALTGMQFGANDAENIARIQVTTQEIAERSAGKGQVTAAQLSEMERQAAAEAAESVQADLAQQARQYASDARRRELLVRQNTIEDIDGSRRLKEITDTDRRGDTTVRYKRADIRGNAGAKKILKIGQFLGKEVIFCEGGIEVDGQYRLANGYRAPDGTIYINVRAENPLAVVFGHEMFHDLVSDGAYAQMIQTLADNPEYLADAQGIIERKRGLYERSGIALDSRQLQEEVGADICGRLFDTPEMLRYIGAKDARTGRTLRAFFSRMLDRLRGRDSVKEAYDALSADQQALIDGMELRKEAEEAGKISYSLMQDAVEQNNRPFAEQFADYKAGRMKPTELFVLGSTSKYLQAAGIADEPIVMAQSVVEKAQRKATIDTHGHSLSDHVLLKLPEMLNKPVLLLRSDTVPNAAVIVTSTVDSERNPVVVALHLNRNNGFDVVTRVASLYGKENIHDFLADQMLRGNLLGYSKKEADRLLHRDGLYLPRRNTAVDFDTVNIAQDTDDVNTQSMQISEKDAGNGKFSLMSDGQSERITPETSDGERTRILERKKIVAENYQGQAAQMIADSKNDLTSRRNALVKSALVRIGDEFGVFTDYNISDIDIEISFSKSGIKESVSKNVNPEQLAKLLPVFKSAVENAVGIESHANRYFYDTETVRFENVLGGYVDGDSFVPVRFGLKHRNSGKAVLYVVVDQQKIPLNKMKAEVLNASLANNSRDKAPRSAYIISLQQMISFVNGKDLLRYLPDGMLNDEQKSVKWDAIAETIKRTNDKNDTRYTRFVSEGKLPEANIMVREAAKAAGYTIKAYHGTGRADRVGTVFRPDRATSGPMAFFTDDRSIAENYARDKADTSIAYDEEYDSYYTQFRVKKDGKDYSVPELWSRLTPSQRAKAKAAAPHIRLDDNAENIIYDANTRYGNGAYDAYTLNMHRGNVLEALIDTWLESGDLYDREADFLEVLKLVGIDGVEYRDPDARQEKVYDVYLGIRNPFDTVNADQGFYDSLSVWMQESDMDRYESESAEADMWDKRSITPEQFLDRLERDIENGTTHVWTSIPDFVTDYLKEQGYDGIKDTGGKNGGASHTVWIPFSSEQVKSADTIVYDDNSNVIPISERFNREKNDIRYSLMSDSQYIRDLVDLGYFEDSAQLETVRSKLEEGTLTLDDIGKLMHGEHERQLLRAAQKKNSVQEQKNAKAVGRKNSAQKKGGSAQKASGKIEVRGADATRLAKQLLGDYDSTLEAKEISKDLQKLAKGILRERSRGNKMTFEQIREQAMPTARKIAQSVELLRDGGKEQIDAFAGVIADEITDQLVAGEVRQRPDHTEQLREVRAERDEKVREVKEHYREKEAKARESRKAQAQRRKIELHAKKLSRDLLRPSDKHHIPIQLRVPVARLLESVNLASSPSVKPGEGRVVTERTKAFTELKKAYAEIGGDLVIDPDLMGEAGVPGLLDEAAALADKSIFDMNNDELETLWKAIRAIEASVRTANRTFASERFATIADAAEALRRDNAGKKAKTELNYIGGLQKLTGLDMLTPEAFLHRLGESGDAIFRMMRDAQDEHIRIMKAVSDFTHETLDEIDVRKLEKELHTVTLGGEKVKLSTAQIMELYVLMRRKQAQEHILIGGILPDTVSSKGVKKLTHAEPVRGITVEEIGDVLSILTPEQKKAAEQLQGYASKELSEYGNRASRQVYNYEKFNEQNYWPIRSNRQDLRSSVEKDTQVTSVANRGFTKSTKPKANNSVMLGSIFDTFATHASEMATYSAWLATTEDINRILNYTFRDSQGLRVSTVKGIVDRVHGQQGTRYLQKLLSDVANGIKGTHGETEYMGGFLGNYKASAIGANLRVIIQQPTAILRALDMIDPKYLIMGMIPQGGWKKARQYAPIAQWKDWGYFDIHTGRQMKDVLFDGNSVIEKIRNAAMVPAGWADSIAWGNLWNAAELETRRKNRDLEPGSRAYYEHVAARFTEIVDRTQVVDGILQRSQIMRSSNGLTKMATSFMGEPTKQYNMFLSAVYDATHGTKEQRTAARKRLARTVLALAVSGVVNAAAQSVMDAVRDDDREAAYHEKWLKAFTGLDGEEDTRGEKAANFILEGNLGSTVNPMGYIPYLKDVLSLIQGYDVSRMDMDSISNTISAAQNMYKALNGEGKYSVPGATAKLLSEAARLTGIPLANFKREVRSFAMLAAIEGDNYLMQYRMEKATLNLNYSGNSGTFYDILYDAYENDREAYEIIYADMVKGGIDEKKIRNAMEERMKKTQGVKEVDQLESRYLSPEQQTVYDGQMKRVQNSSLWKKATEVQREELEKLMYNLSVENSAGEKMQEKIDGGAAYGIDTTDYLLYQLALDLADEPNASGNLGTYTNAEVQAAIEMVPGLDDDEKSYLWLAAGKNEKSNPWG